MKNRIGPKGWGLIIAAVGVFLLIGAITSEGNIWNDVAICCGVIAVGAVIFFLPKIISKIPVGSQQLKVETFRAAGCYYYEQNIKRLAVDNPEWSVPKKDLLAAGKEGKRIYRYNFTNEPVKLVQENTNREDKNAVMIKIAGQKVGYIPASQAVHVRKILNWHNVKYISAFIGGGEYKIPLTESNAPINSESYHVTVKIGYV